MDRVQHDVGSKGEYDAREHAREHGADASTNTSRKVRLVHDGLAPFSRLGVPRDASSSASLS